MSNDLTGWSRLVVNLKGLGRKWLWTISRYCHGIRLKDLSNRIHPSFGKGTSSIQARSGIAWANLLGNSRLVRNMSRVIASVRNKEFVLQTLSYHCVLFCTIYAYIKRAYKREFMPVRPTSAHVPSSKLLIGISMMFDTGCQQWKQSFEFKSGPHHPLYMNVK